MKYKDLNRRQTGFWWMMLLGLFLSGCSDSQLGSAEASRRAWICQHKVLTAASSNIQIQQAYRIADENVRAAVIARAQDDLAIVAACP